MKQLKDYLHLYIGCVIVCDNKDCHSDLEYYGMKRKVSHLLIDKYLNGNWKPILRPLSDMTASEFAVFKNITDNDFSKMVVIDSASEEGCFTRLAHQLNSSHYLLSLFFDIFGLIEAGLAIDATKVERSVATEDAQ